MFILLDKQKGLSSFKTIKNFAKKNNIKKIGHTGTLDPLATGLLLVATDNDTKLIDYIDKGSKKYIATMLLGHTSDTYDIEGTIIKTNKTIPTISEISSNLKTFLGEQEQLPPQFSAKKVNGQPAYKMAREGKFVNLKLNKIVVESIELKSFENNLVIFETVVSRGAYIRSIIHDLGQKLGCGALMTELRRTEIGSLKESDLGMNINIDKLLAFPIINLTIDQINILLKGKKLINETNQKGQFIIKVNNVICGIANLDDLIKSIKLFGNKIDTI